MEPADNSLEQNYEGSNYDSSLESSGAPQSSIVKGDNEPERSSLSPFRYNKLAFLVSGAALTIIALIGVGSLLFAKAYSGAHTPESAAQKASNYAISTLSTQGVKGGTQLQVGQAEKLAINGQLQVGNTVIISPTATPTNATAGQIYYDRTTNQLYYYNGTQFVSMTPTAIPQSVSSLGGASGAISLGSGLNLAGNQLSVSSSLLQSIANAGNLGGPRVDSLQGLTGNVTLTAGSGISINGTTITNSGVISLVSGSPSITVTNDGSGNYTVSQSGGPSGVTSLDSLTGALTINNSSGSGSAVTINDAAADGATKGIATFNATNFTASAGVINTIQDISTTANPTFNGLTLTNALTVANGGTGAGSFTANGILYGNGAGTVQVTGAAANSILATDGSSVPGLTQTLPAAVQGNITSTGALSSGSIASGFGTITTTNNIGTTATVQGGVVNATSTLELNGANINTAGTLTNVAYLNQANTFTAAGTALTVNNNAVIGGTLAVQGAGGLTLGIPGSATGNLNLSNTTSAREVILQGLNPTGAGNATIQIPSVAGGSTDTICLLTLANCVGSGNAVTSPGGTTNAIAKFTGSRVIGDSGISDDGSNVTIAGGETLVAGTISASTLQSAGTLTITPGGNLTIGATNHQFLLQGNGSSTIAVSSGGNTTTVGFVAPTGARAINFPDESGTICLQNSVNCGFAAGGSGVTSLDGLTGTLTVANSSGLGTTITIDNAKADGSTKGIATFNSTNFTDNGSGVINTIQGISTTSNVQFGSLGVGIAGTGISGDVNIAPAGTLYVDTIKTTATGAGNLSLYSDGVGSNITFFTDGGANSFTFPSVGGTGQTICTSGITCASGGGQAVILEPGTGSGTVQTASANRTAIWVNKAAGTGNLIQLQDGGTDAFVIDNAGNTTITTGSVTNGFTIGGTLGVNTITPSGALTIGATGQSFTLQGNGSSVMTATGGGALTTVGYAIGSGPTAPNGNVTYQFANDNTVAAGTYTVCTTAGNCAGVGGSITGSGTAGNVAKFTATGAIGNSILTDNGTTVTVGGNLAVGTSGASQLSIGVGSSVSGTLVFNNSTNNNTTTLQLAAAPAGNVTLKLPNTSGTFAVGASGPLALDATTGQLTCSTCLTTTTGVVSLDSQTGVLTLANSSGASGTITINNAAADGATKGIATFNSTNFTASSGVVNTIQDIATGSSPTFSNLTLTGATGLVVGSASNLGQIAFKDGTADGFKSTFSPATLTGNQTITVPNASGTLAVSASGNLSLSALGALTFSNSPTFSGTVTVQGSGGLTLGVPGSTIGSLNLANGTSTREVILQGLNPSGSGNATVQIPSIAGGTTDAVCLVALGNCAGSGGGITGSGTAGNIAKFSGTGSITNSSLSESGTTVTASGKVVIQGASSLSLGTASTNTGSIAFSNATNANTVTLQSGVSGSNFSLTLPTTGGNNGDCLQSQGAGVLAFTACTGGAGGGVTSLDSQTGVLTLANSSGASGTITINNAAADGATKGIATFNSTNFTASSGVVNTIQDIATGSSPTFNALTLQGSSALTLGTASTNTGAIVFKGSGGAGTLTLQGPTTPNVGNFTLSIPAITGNANICTDNSVCTGYAPASGSGNYIQNGTTTQVANFNIQSAGTGSVTATIQGTGGQTADLLDLIDGSTNKVLTVGSTGNVLLQPSTNSTTALQIQNASGTATSDTLVSLSTVANANNMITNPSFEQNTSPWAPSSNVALTQVTNQTPPFGTGAMQITSSGSPVAKNGAIYTVNMTNNGVYNLSFYAKTALAFSTMTEGFTTDGSTMTTTGCSTTQAPSITLWLRFNCTFTYTGSTNNNVSGIFIGQNDTTARTWYVDGVSLEQVASGTFYKEGTLNWNGVALGNTLIQPAANSNAAFQVANVAGVNGLLVDTNSSALSTSFSATVNSTLLVNTGSATALQVRNSTSLGVLIKGDESIPQTGNNSNAINNDASFENGTTGWAVTHNATEVPTFATDATTNAAGVPNAFSGATSLKVASSASSVANSGVKYNLSSSGTITLASNTTYTLSFEAKLVAGQSAFTTLDAGRSDNGTTGGESACTLDNTTVTFNWQRYTCTFKTGTTSGTPYLFIGQSDASTVHSYYLDAVNFENTSNVNANNFREGRIQLNGDITSPTVFRVQSDSTNAFQVQNSNGGQLLVADTTTPNNDVDGSVETGIFGYTAIGTGTTIAQTTSQAYIGANSLQVSTTSSSVANDGVHYNNGTTTIATSTQYTLSFYAKIASGSFTTLVAGRADNGASNTGCTLNSTTVTTVWQRFSCTFTTGTVSGTPYIYIGQSDAGVAHTYFLDGIQLEANSSATPYKEGTLQVNGIISSPLVFQNANDSTTALQVQNSSGTNLLVVDTADGQLAVGPSAVPANGVLTVGTNTTAASGGVYFGTDTNLYRSTASTLKTDGSLTVGSALAVTTTATIQGANALTLGTASTNTGAIVFKGSGGAGTLTLAGPTTPNVGNFTLSLPTITGNDTVCAATLSNCSATGTAGGDLTGSYPNPTIAKLQGTTLTLSSLASGDVLQYNGSAIVNGHITNSNLTAGTFGSITGTGALAAGSIAAGFGTISTNNNITTSTTVQGATVNATTALQLGGANINTAGTLSNVAYLNAASQSFTGVNTFSRNGTGTGDYSLGVTGTPINDGTSSLIRIGNAISGGNSAANGGTYIGLNEPSSGAGSTADFLNFQNNGTSEFKVTSAGAITNNSSITSSSTVFVSGTGSATAFKAVKPAGNPVLQNFLLSTDVNPSLNIIGDGTINWGAGGGSATDTNLYRGAAGVLKTDSTLNVVTAYQLNGAQIVDGSRNLTNIGTITSGLINGQTISSSANFTGGVTVQGSGGLTIGTTSQIGSLVLNDGNGGSNKTATLQAFPTLGQNTTYTLPDPGFTTATVCVTANSGGYSNCAGAGSGVTVSGSATANFVTKFTGTGNAIATSQLFDNGSFVGINTLTDSGKLSVVSGSASEGGLYVQQSTSSATVPVAIIQGGATPGAGADLLDLKTSASTVAKFDNAGNLTAVGGTFSGNFSQTGSTTFSTGSGTVSLNGAITASGTYNTNTFNSNTLQFGAAGTATIDSASGQTLQIGTGANTHNVVIGSTTGGTTTLQSAGGVAVSTLGTANSVTYLCRNGSNLISTCQTNATGAAFVQGGNSFGATAELGTNDANSLNFRTNNGDRLTLDTSGNLQFLQASTLNIASAATGTQLTIKGGAATSGTNVGGNLLLQGGAGASTGASGSVIVQSNGNNSTTAFQVQNASNANLFTVDSANSNVSILTNNTGETQAWNCQGTNTAACGGTLSPINTNNLTAARRKHSTVISNGYIYVLGGVDGAGTDQTTVQYAKLNANGSTGTWSTTTVLPAARSVGTAVTMNGYIYYLGGSSLDTVLFAKQNSDGTVGAWKCEGQSTANCGGSLAPVNANSINAGGAVNFGASFTANGYIYVIASSGSNTVTYYAKAYADGTTGAWSTTTGLTGAVVNLAGVSIANGYVYLVGGEDGSSAARSTTLYNSINANGTLGATWHCDGPTNISSQCGSGSTFTLLTLPGSATADATSTQAANGYLYVLGGINGSTNKAIYYTKLNADGSLVGYSTSANTLPTALWWGGTAMANGYIYLTGGYDGTNVLQNVDFVSLSRISVAGSLDLVGTSGQDLQDNGSQAGSLTAGNTLVVGTLGVSGAANFLQGVSVAKDLAVGGSALFQNAGDSTNAFRVNVHDGTQLFNLDTTNGEATIGNTIATGNELYVQSNADTVIRGKNTGSAALLQLANSTADVFSVANAGATTIKTTTDTTTAFQVQNHLSSVAFDVDTSNTRVGIGTNAPGNLLSIGALTTAQSGYQVAVSTGGTTNSGIVIQDVASQSSGNLLQAENSSGTTLASIDYQGNLSVKAATVNGNLTLNGHLITANSSGSTTATKTSALGTTGTCSVTGNDTAGSITMTSGGTGTANGDWCTITFGSAFGSAPNVVVGGANSNGSDSDPYADNVGTGSFKIGSVNNSNLFSGNITLYYIVAQ